MNKNNAIEFLAPESSLDNDEERLLLQEEEKCSSSTQPKGQSEWMDSSVNNNKQEPVVSNIPIKNALKVKQVKRRRATSKDNTTISRVIMKPLTHEKRDRPQAFSKKDTDILYLELVENKEKIKPEVVNEEYKPPSSSVFLSKDEKESLLSSSSCEKEDGTKKEETVEEKLKNILTAEEEGEGKKNNKVYGRKREGEGRGSRIRTRSSILNRPSISSSSDSLNDKKNNNEKEEKEAIIKKIRHPSYSSHYPEQNKNELSLEEEKRPPTLSEITKDKPYETYKQGVKELKGSYEDEKTLKINLLNKFELLKKQYKGAVVPEFTVHSDYHTMQSAYNSAVRNLHIDSSVENYKKYLMAGFALMEFLFGKWFPDIQGYTQEQMVCIGEYEKLLVELGEKSYVKSASSKWPVELRLVGLVIFNAVLFILVRVIFRKSGILPPSSTKPSTQPKKRMKGPSVNAPSSD
jgi:hypothetical protein